MEALSRNVGCYFFADFENIRLEVAGLVVHIENLHVQRVMEVEEVRCPVSRGPRLSIVEYCSWASAAEGEAQFVQSVPSYL